MKTLYIYVLQSMQTRIRGQPALKGKMDKLFCGFLSTIIQVMYNNNNNNNCVFKYIQVQEGTG